jgi:2-phospho-L-lactate transferase/gluconeogenesis factor (CofD/UPF0052 family)
MFAPQNKQAERKRIVEFLARESGTALDAIAHLYDDEVAKLTIGARITSFLPIFAIRNVQEALRQRSATTSSMALHDGTHAGA